MAVSVAERLGEVRERMSAACTAAGRHLDDVALVAVSKTHSTNAIREAYASGQRIFGENYVQELLRKAEELSDLPDLQWRFIGHLQRNKAKKVVGIGSRIDTLDSLRLAEAVAKAAGSDPVPVLIQVNVGEESQKSGVLPTDLNELVRGVRAISELRLDGLMTVPPADPSATRRAFARLRELAMELELPELSMGMSSDLEQAIAAGSTLVRVGTAIFGPRPRSA